MKKLLEERKREKEEEKLARQRVKEQIEADKAARRAKANAEKIVTESLSTPSSSTNIYRKEYNDTKLQVNNLHIYKYIILIVMFERYCII